MATTWIYTSDVWGSAPATTTDPEAFVRDLERSCPDWGPLWERCREGTDRDGTPVIKFEGEIVFRRRGRGRPPSDRGRSSVLSVRLYPPERDAVAAICRALNVDEAEAVRRALVAFAERGAR